MTFREREFRAQGWFEGQLRGTGLCATAMCKYWRCVSFENATTTGVYVDMRVLPCTGGQRENVNENVGWVCDGVVGYVLMDTDEVRHLSFSALLYLVPMLVSVTKTYYCSESKNHRKFR